MVNLEFCYVQHSINANNLTISQPVPPLPITNALRLDNFYLI